MACVYVDSIHSDDMALFRAQLERITYVREATPSDALPSLSLDIRLPKEPLFWSSEYMVFLSRTYHIKQITVHFLIQQNVPWCASAEWAGLSFHILYALNCHLSWGSVQRHSLTNRFFDTLSSYPEEIVVELLHSLWSPHENIRTLFAKTPDISSKFRTLLTEFHPSTGIPLPAGYVKTRRYVSLFFSL